MSRRSRLRNSRFCLSTARDNRSDFRGQIYGIFVRVLYGISGGIENYAVLTQRSY
jgi:hypothetical protein